MLSSGHHNEVLRNILLRLQTNKERYGRLREILSKEFRIDTLESPFSPRETEFLRATYDEPGNRIPLDLVSGGSGFLQVLQILAHALQNPSPLLLLDEPDAHMHSALQRSFLVLLNDLAEEEQFQVVMASHSETFIRAIELENMRVIDPQRKEATRVENAAILQEQLSEAGIWPDHLELAEILRTRRVLLVEGREDKASLDYLGRIIHSDWDARRKLVQIIYSDGSSHATTVSRIQYINKVLQGIMPEGIEIAHVRDRDLFTDEGVEVLIRGAASNDLRVFVSERRNREAFLVSPAVVSRALLKHCKEKLPRELLDPARLEEKCEGIILSWCKSVIDEVPSKVREYNLHWLRKECEDQSEYRNAEKRLDRFLREEWSERITAGEIPWKLVDGKAALSFLRTYLQEYGIHLPETHLHDVMSQEDYGESLNDVAKLVLKWTE